MRFVPPALAGTRLEGFFHRIGGLRNASRSSCVFKRDSACARIAQVENTCVDAFSEQMYCLFLELLRIGDRPLRLNRDRLRSKGRSRVRIPKSD